MTRNKTRKVGAFCSSFLTSAFLGAAAALLLAATLSTPTSGRVRVTSVEPDNGEANYFVDLGILGGCTNIPKYSSSDQPGPDCRTTKVGYEATLLLPYRINDTDTDASSVPYPLTRQYFIVKEGDARDMVLVPVTTAFELLGLILHVLSAGVKKPLWGWIAMGTIGLAAILSWASFGVTYRFTDTVQQNLEMYNTDPVRVIDHFTAHRGNAVWFLLAAAALLTVALLGMLWMQHEKRQAARAPRTMMRKGSGPGDQAMEMSC